MEKSEKKIISSKSFASAIKFLTGMKYEEVPHHKVDGRSVFLFEDNELLQSTIEGLMDLRNKLNN